MRAILLFTAAALACLASTSAYEMFVGTTINATLDGTYTLKKSAIPFIKRVEEKFYTVSNTKRYRAIKGIICSSVNGKRAIVALTPGGVGHPYVGIRLKSSARGDGFNYTCRIYA